MVTRNGLERLLLCVVLIGGLFVSALSSSALDNTGFEVPDQGSTGFEYAPAGASWGFSATTAGLSGPNGPWKCNSTSPDPLGDQFAYLQRASSIT